MTMDITADHMFAGGHCAPRGTYLCLQSGVVHRLSRPTTLPIGGPFRMVAPTDAIGALEPVALTKATPVSGEFRWPEDNAMPKEDTGKGIFTMMAAYRISRSGIGW